ncbi:MAG: AGE family epimerase/isomerase [Bacteroidota bacterium]|nr:AGE family epimerase/isomerase [Bacteroidota bacterium]
MAISSSHIVNKLQQYRQEMKDELSSILHYWQEHTMDETNGGFWGKINNQNIPDVYAPKGVVLNARILWTFSAAYSFTQNKEHLQIAERAFFYLLTYFKDPEYGGVYWSVDYKGTRLENRKQIYGLSFVMYGMSEFYSATQNEAALRFAKELFITIEQHSFDAKQNGYFEAFARDWKSLNDLRLSLKDANASKTANTHLHIVEAYANLYKIWQNQTLKEKIENLLFLFDEYFINKQTNHLTLFFDDEWNEQPDVISYGHDIEAAWLLLQCAETIDNEQWILVYQQHAKSLADAASEGLNKDGGMWYEYEIQHKKIIKQKHWWPQAEAMIGYLNAYQITGDEKYLQHSLNGWKFVQKQILDTHNGEWFWGVDEAYQIMPNEDKAGFWKCPYHNARACMEVIKRIDKQNL